MTTELLCRCTSHTKRRKDETTEQFLARVTHLYCAEKGIEEIVRTGYRTYFLKIAHLIVGDTAAVSQSFSTVFI